MRARARLRRTCGRRSIDDLALRARKPILPLLNVSGRALGPVGHLTDHLQRSRASVRAREVPREALVGDVGIVLEATRGLDDVDALAPIPFRQRRRETG